MMTHNLQQHARRIIAYSNRARFLCSYTNGVLTSPARNHTLQTRIEAAIHQKADVSTVLEQWREQGGKQLNPSLVRRIVEKLRDSKRFRHALDVSDWMIEQKICMLVPEDFAARFHLIENVLGLEEAEKYFESIPKNQRGESIYTALLNSYASRWGRKYLDKAESTFKKMRELGLLLRSSPYNSMLSLYSSLGKREKVDEILLEMKETNIELDSLSVNNALRVYAAVSDVETMEKFLGDWEATATLEGITTNDMAMAYLRAGSKEKAREMLLRTEELKERNFYEELMTLYGEVGERDDVYRIWDLYKNTREKDNEGFRALIASLLKLDDIKGAEEMYSNEWECSGLEFDIRIPNMLASSYRQKGMVEKAGELMDKTIMRNKEMDRPITPLLEEWVKRGRKVKPSDLRDQVKNLCDSKQFSKALEALEFAGEKRMFNLFPEDYAIRLHVIENVLGLEEAEKFFETSIPENMKDCSVYATLLASYTRSYKTLGKAEALFEMMGELGLLSQLSPFKSMISLYSQLGRRSKVEDLLCKLKENSVEPDSLTINNVLRVYADETDIETMEKYKREWDRNANLEVRTRVAMAKAYERAGLLLKAMKVTGSKNEVCRIWDEYKKKPIAETNKDEGSRNEGYRSLISSLLELGDVKGAEEVYGEWQPEGSKSDSRVPCMLISRYCEENDIVKVREVVKSSRKKRMGRYLRLVYPPLTTFIGVACAVYALN